MADEHEHEVEHTGFLKVHGDFLPLGTPEEEQELIALTHGGTIPFILIQLDASDGNINTHIKCTGMKPEMMRSILIELSAGLHDSNRGPCEHHG
jgi:hypothetical protein